MRGNRRQAKPEHDLRQRRRHAEWQPAKALAVELGEIARGQPVLGPDVEGPRRVVLGGEIEGLRQIVLPQQLEAHRTPLSREHIG